MLIRLGLAEQPRVQDHRDTRGISVDAQVQARRRRDVKRWKVFGGTDDPSDANGLRKLVGSLKAGKALDHLFGCALAGRISEEEHLALPGMFTGQLHPFP